MPSAKIFAQPTVSVEYFPPRGLSAERSLMTGAHALKRFSPAYQTVTFGAGGSATEGSFDWSVGLQGLNEVPTATHIALCHFTRESLVKFAENLWQHGIRRLVVLRGDALVYAQACLGIYICKPTNALCQNMPRHMPWHGLAYA